MENRPKPLGYYNYTVVLTYIGLLTGFLGIVSVTNYKINTALICLMMAGLCDMFDGTIAATRPRNDDEKCFGIQIDSLCDLICFGVLPALTVYKNESRNNIAFAVTGLYLLCTLIRLAYFNVDEQNRQKETAETRKYYFGLPVTSIALILPLGYAIETTFGLTSGMITMVATGATAIMFLSPFRIKKPGNVGKIVMTVIGILELVFLVISRGAN